MEEALDTATAAVTQPDVAHLVCASKSTQPQTYFRNFLTFYTFTELHIVYSYAMQCVSPTECVADLRALGDSAESKGTSIDCSCTDLSTPYQQRYMCVSFSCRPNKHAPCLYLQSISMSCEVLQSVCLFARLIMRHVHSASNVCSNPSG